MTGEPNFNSNLNPGNIPVNTSGSDEANTKDTIFLDNIDGYEFEKLCADIFQKLNFGTVKIMPFSGDKGRDLIIDSPKGTIIVECKHNPNSSVGRPVVQKLHSAVISSNAVQGILITTGSFSPNAVEHAKELSPKIELMDNQILISLAEKAGINLLFDSQTNNILQTTLSKDSDIEHKILSFFESRFESKPEKILRLVTFSDRTITCMPTYMVHFNLNALFETGVGVIHNEIQNNGYLFIDGATGQLMPQEISDYLKSAHLSTYDDTIFDQSRYHRHNFFLDEKSIVTTVKKIVIEQHTRIVSYYGKNNQNYRKECIPSQKDIFITDIKKVYIPKQQLKIKILQKEYLIEGIENSQKILCTTQHMNCSVCGKYINEKGMICNSCGALVHEQRFLDSHGFRCKQCGKTICRKCTRAIGLNKKVCSECAEQSGVKGNILPDSTNQIPLISMGIFILGFTFIFIFNNAIFGLILFGIGIILLFSGKYPTNPPYETI